MPLRSRRGVSVTYHIACKPPFLCGCVDSLTEPRCYHVNGSTLDTHYIAVLTANVYRVARLLQSMCHAAMAQCALVSY